MKTLILTLGVLLTFLPVTTMAEPISVRSGQHSTFSRLVLALPDGVTWKLKNELGKHTLTFENHNDGFDISSVFQRMPRTWLTDLTNTQSELHVKVNCDCELRVFEEANDLLVLDILEGPPLSAEDLEPVVEKVVPESAASDNTRVALPSNFEFGQLLWSNQNELIAPRELPDLAAPELEIAINSPEKEILEETLEALLSGISEAATRGILEPATTSEPDTVPKHLETESPPIFDSSSSAPSQPTLSSNIRVTTSQDTPSSQQHELISSLGTVCPDPSQIQVETWGGASTFGAELGAARTALYQEFDRIGSTEVLSLVRLYLYYGFGAEAKQVLNMSAPLKEEFPYLSLIADVLEFGSSENSSAVRSFSDCDSDMAFWAVLANAEITEADKINVQATLRTMEKLPVHLRQFLGPVLSDRLMQNGDFDSAATVLRNLDRTNLSQNSEATLVHAEIQKEQGNEEISNRILKEVINENDAQSPLALIRYVDQHLASDQVIPADIALLVEAYAFELRNDAIGPSMQRAHVLASAKSGQFRKAFDAMPSLQRQQDQRYAGEVYSLVVKELAEKSDDSEFLNHVFGDIFGYQGQLDAQVGIDTAQRIYDLGFPKVAAGFLERQTEARASNSGRILQAQIALSAGQPDLALDALDGLTGPNATKTKAKALRDLGASEEAVQLFQSVDEVEAAELTAWLSTDWQDILASDRPLYSQLLTIAKTNIKPIRTEDGMLESSRNALEESSNTRETLNRILSEMPKPVSPSP